MASDTFGERHPQFMVGFIAHKPIISFGQLCESYHRPRGHVGRQKMGSPVPGHLHQIISVREKNKTSKCEAWVGRKRRRLHAGISLHHNQHKNQKISKKWWRAGIQIFFPRSF